MVIYCFQAGEAAAEVVWTQEDVVPWAVVLEKLFTNHSLKLPFLPVLWHLKAFLSGWSYSFNI